jgi:hypothetical protein
MVLFMFLYITLEWNKSSDESQSGNNRMSLRCISTAENRQGVIDTPESRK